MKSASTQANSDGNMISSLKTIVKAKREKGVITTVQVINVETESPHDNNYQKAAAEYFLFIAEMEGLIK
jgi:hypothetical protein